MAILNKKLSRDESGASAVIIAISIGMLVTCTGIVIDGGTMLLSKSRAQGALDAAVLAAAKVPVANRTTEANKLFKANFPVDLTPYPQVTLTEPTAGVLRGTVTVVSDTLFMRFAGINNMTVNLSTDVQYGASQPVGMLSVAFDTSAAMGRPLSGGGGLRIDVLTQELQAGVNGYYTGGTPKYLSVIPYSDVIRTKSLTTTNWTDPTTLPNPITIPASVSLNLTCKGVRKGKASLLTDDAPTTNATKFPLYLGAMEFPSQFVLRGYDFNGSVVTSFNGTHPTFVKDRAPAYRSSPWYMFGVQPYTYSYPAGIPIANYPTGGEPAWQQVPGGARNNRIEYNPATGRGESVRVTMPQGQGYFWSALYYDLTPFGPAPSYSRYGLTDHHIGTCVKNELGQVSPNFACGDYTLPTIVPFNSSYPQWPTTAGISSALASTWAYGGGDGGEVDFTFTAMDNGQPAATNTKIAYNFYYMPICANKEAMFLEKDKTKAYNYFTNFYQCDTPSGCGLWPPGLRKFLGGATRTDRGIAWLQYTTSNKWRGFLNPAEPSQPDEATLDRNVLLIAHGENQVPAEDDPNTLAICTNLKNRGITVHTIAYDASMATRSLMQQCATSGKSHNVDTRAQLQAALANIVGGGTGTSNVPAKIIR